jgi:hypothetical protein
MHSEASYQDKSVLAELAFIDARLDQVAGRLAHAAQMNLVTASSPSAAIIRRYVASLADIQHQVRSLLARLDDRPCTHVSQFALAPAAPHRYRRVHKDLGFPTTPVPLLCQKSA